MQAVQELARDIIFGQLRATITTMDIEEINGDRETFESRVLENIEGELIKIGLRLINVNISDITDESGYIRWFAGYGWEGQGGIKTGRDVVMAAMLAALLSAVRTTLTGSMMPALYMSTYSPVLAS